MKKLTVLISLIALGVLCASGVALAANVQCRVPTEGQTPSQCRGTAQSDRILGTEGTDDIRARQGDDVVTGFADDDVIFGGTGADRLYGSTGSDAIIASAFMLGMDEENPGKFVDSSDDLIRGGAQADELYGGFGQSGRDQVFGDDGDDLIFVSQRFFRAQGYDTKITREFADCGLGDDTVVYDDGIDRRNTDNCENQVAIAPNGQPVNPPPAGMRSVESLSEFPF